MDLQTYLTKSSSRPNKQVLQSLGATEEQIEYIMETPENFNWNVWDGLSNVSNEFLVIFGGKTAEEDDNIALTGNIPVQATPKQLIDAINSKRILHCKWSKYLGMLLGYNEDGETASAPEGVLIGLPNVIVPIDINNKTIQFKLGEVKTINYTYTEQTFNVPIILVSAISY